MNKNLVRILAPLIVVLSLGAYVPFSITSSIKNVRVVSAIINSGCTSVTSQIGSAFSSASSGGTGQCTLSFAANSWTSSPYCVAQAGASSASAGEVAIGIVTTSTSTFQWYQSQPGVGAVNRQATVFCVGVK